MRNTLFILKFE